ncbi:MAG: hypothetical protein HQL37_16370 [Alphaproteobacteria bacterium]|nr:hypothetical protein [Alphaproteobacteria bacterium]
MPDETTPAIAAAPEPGSPQPPRPFEQVSQDVATAKAKLADIDARKRAMIEEVTGRRMALEAEEATLHTEIKHLLAEAEAGMTKTKAELASLESDLGTALGTVGHWLEHLVGAR